MSIPKLTDSKSESTHRVDKEPMLSDCFSIEEETRSSIGLFQEISSKSRNPAENREASVGLKHK